MAKFSIDGKWSGKVSYGSYYPAAYKNKKLLFTLQLSSQNAVIKGTCEDDTTRELKLAPAFIEGFFRENVIQFVKYYSSLVIFDEQNKLKAIANEPSVRVEYKGSRYWKLFSRKKYFKGTWEIVTPGKHQQGNISMQRPGGTWMMESA